MSAGTVYAGSTAGGTDWRRAVEPYTGPNGARASLQLITTLGALALGIAVSYVAMQWSVLLSILIAFPIAGLIVRTFVLMHDCAHGSFFPSRGANDTVGFITGVLTLTPFAQWRRDHALHHASSGDLDRRGHGDVPTLTVREYLAKPRRERLAYRIKRNPFVLMLVGPIHLAVGQRFRGKDTTTDSAQFSSVVATNLAIVAAFAIAVLTIGLKAFLVVYALPYYVAAMAGVWLFYVQHQFEDAYWASHENWDYVQASLRGSSHLKMPAVLNWFTGDIGLHHVHHVAPRIPNYRLQRCHNDNALFQDSPVVTLRSGTAALALARWDEDRKRLVRFRDAHRS